MISGLVRVGILSLVAITVTGCAARRQLPSLVEERPLSILVVPLTNQTPDLEAPEVGQALLAIPLAERGYYVYPPALTKALLIDLGLPDAGLVHQMSPIELGKDFGADAVLFVVVEDWTTKYIGIWSSVSVGFSYSLRSAYTGEELWSARSRASKDSGVGNPIAMAVVAAMNALLQTYPPLVRQAHFMGLNQEGVSLPAGPYHPAHTTEYISVATPAQAEALRAGNLPSRKTRRPEEPGAVD